MLTTSHLTAHLTTKSDLYGSLNQPLLQSTFFAYALRSIDQGLALPQDAAFQAELLRIVKDPALPQTIRHEAFCLAATLGATFNVNYSQSNMRSMLPRFHKVFATSSFEAAKLALDQLQPTPNPEFTVTVYYTDENNIDCKLTR